MHIILLTGAALIGVPVLLHLIMRQEPKKLPFPAFRFLKMKRRINQRKMRLRHLFLLLMRMFLIALIAFALFQPTLLSNRFNIKGERPIACVIVIDTSPSMGYVLAVDRGGLSNARKRGPVLLEEDSPEDRARAWTALDEGRFRAIELLDNLPPGSKVAVIDTADRDCFWSLSPADARKKIREIHKTKASSRTITQTLPLAYQLFGKVDQEAGPGQENMPRLLCVFSDRTAPSWDSAQAPYLLEMKENVPKPEIVSAYIDVGIDKPLNLAITGVEMKPQVVAANKPIEFTVILEATGAVQENTVQVRFNDESKPSMAQFVHVEPGVPKEVTFRRSEGLPPNLYTAEISLQTPDALPTDDIRYLTFRVREPRKVLAVADAPLGLGALGGGLATIRQIYSAAGQWRRSLESQGWYSCDFTTTRAFVETKPANLAPYEAIVFAGFINPSNKVWENANSYVESGGKLIVVPGAEELLTDGSGKPPPGYDNKLLPGLLKTWIKTGRDTPVTWAWDALKAHPLLIDIKQWVQNPRYMPHDDPPQAWGYWEVAPSDKLSTIVSYADNTNADERRPALLEKRVGRSGQVLLYTTPMDNRYSKSIQDVSPGYWNDYDRDPKGWFYLWLTNFAVRYLIGNSEDAVFNYVSGQNLTIKWPLDAAARSKLYYLSGPDVGDKEAEIIRGDNETTVRLGPERLKSAGNYLVISDPSDQKPELKQWRDGFSLNQNAEESNLERLPVEQIEAVFGPKSVTTSDKERTIEDILGGKFSAPVELFPFLMILLLLFLAFENLLSNKFYRQAKPEKG